METRCALLWPLGRTQGSYGGGKGRRRGLEVVFEEGGDDVGVRVSELLDEVVVVVAGFGKGLGIPRVGLSELGVDDAWMRKRKRLNRATKCLQLL
ncbi:hypothetical protein NL676_032703 [Syzygium grande]|nr:hypothetical protein NL676_032703 [Syzygium grande]